MSKMTDKVITQADHQLAELQAQHADIEKKLSDIDSSIVEIEQKQSDRAHELEKVQHHLSLLQSELQRLQSYTAVALGTNRESAAVKEAADAKIKVQQKQLEHDALTAANVRNLKAETTKLQELKARKTELQQQLKARSDMITGLEEGREVALERIGQELFTALVKEHSSRKQEIVEMRLGLASKLMEMHIFEEESLEKLHAWPEHESAFDHKIDKKDAIEDVILAEIHYVNMLMQHARLLNNTVLPRHKSPHGGTTPLLMYLFVTPDEIMQSVRTPSILEKRIEVLQNLFDEYRNCKQSK